MIDRRLLIGLMSAAAAAPAAFSQQTGTPVLKRARTNVLEIAYEESGPESGFPVLLMHGFPYDPRAFDDVVPPLVAAGYQVIVPYLRGYGQTRFLEADTPRSGQQAALGRDLIELMDALALPSAVLAGFDWGGRAACVAAALWPERVAGLVSANGYNIQDIAGSVVPASPQQEHRLWYQYYFHTERGRAGLQTNRRELCKLLWQLWSPNWKFDDATYARTADFRFFADGDPPVDLAAANRRLADHTLPGAWMEDARGRSSDSSLAYCVGVFGGVNRQSRCAYAQLWQYAPKVANWGLRLLLINPLAPSMSK